MTDNSVNEEFFEGMYRRNADPWNFATSQYEQARYEAVLNAVPPRRYRRAFEPGCSVGILTEKLATFCNQVEAMDISKTAVCRARMRCGHLRNVAVAHGALPDALPEGDFDLIVFSEVGYYFQPAALRALVSALAGRLVPSGVLVAAHWLGHSPDHLMSGDGVHAIIAADASLAPLASERHEGFRIDLWTPYE